MRFDSDFGNATRNSDPVVQGGMPLYTKEVFRAILARQPEWKIRAALEDGNIPSPHAAHAIEWLEEIGRNHTVENRWSWH